MGNSAERFLERFSFSSFDAILMSWLCVCLLSDPSAKLGCAIPIDKNKEDRIDGQTMDLPSS